MYNADLWTAREKLKKKIDAFHVSVKASSKNNE